MLCDISPPPLPAPPPALPLNHQQTLLDTVSFACIICLFFILPPWDKYIFLSFIDEDTDIRRAYSYLSETGMDWLCSFSTPYLFSESVDRPQCVTKCRVHTANWADSLRGQVSIHLNLKAVLRVILSLQISRLHQGPRNGDTADPWNLVRVLWKSYIKIELSGALSNNSLVSVISYDRCWEGMI